MPVGVFVTEALQAGDSNTIAREFNGRTSNHRIMAGHGLAAAPASATCADLTSECQAWHDAPHDIHR